MTYKCKSCGAKLNIKKNQAEVKCGYCGTNNKIEYTQSDFLRDSSKRSKKYTKYILIGAAVMTLFSLIPILRVHVLSPKSSNSPANQQTEQKITENKDGHFDYEASICPVKSKNDDLINIVSVAEKKGKYSSEGFFLHLIDGKTGEIKDSVKIDTDSETEIFSVNNTYVFLSDDYILKVFDNQLSEIKTISLNEKLKYYDVFSDTNKLYLGLHGNKVLVLDMDTWNLEKPKDQKSIVQRHREFTGVSSMPPTPRQLIGKQTVKEDGIIYSIEEEGSKKLMTIYAKEGSKEHWKLPLNYSGSCYSWDPCLELIDQLVVLFGEKPDTEAFFIMGIDKIEGRLAYEKKIDIDGLDYLSDIIYNNKYIIATFNRRKIVAFEPATGNIKWQIGRD